MHATMDYARTAHRKPDRLLAGLDAKVHGLIGHYRRRSQVLRDLSQEADKVDGEARIYKDLSDHLLRERLWELRDQIRRGGRHQSALVVPALAAIREAADRQVGLRAFTVQLVGTLALHRGFLAEMATGEGKTLTAGLAAVLAGWTRKPCHIITVNDYLVQRDAEWLKNLYTFCGIKVGFVTGAMQPEDRRKGYNCDITYTTSKEVVADFLRDGLQAGALRDPTRRLIRRMLLPAATVTDGLVMRGLHTAIVDEADSILIDEAVVPLIIATARKNEALNEVVQLARRIVEPLDVNVDYHINRRYREIELTEEGSAKVAQRCAALPGLWQGESRRKEIITQALVAREFYNLDKQYVISDGRVVIVDEFTGRPMPQRSWRQGMHQAIEAKEKLNITDPNETIARLSFQRYFRLYHRLSGMTGTARETAAEFWQIYRLPVVSIPPNKPCIRTEMPDRIYPTENAKWQAIVETVQNIHATGRPILIGTRSVAASEKLAARLAAEGFDPKVLNAVRHQEEALVIAEAGVKHRITIATNMAGRGTDIRLGTGVAELGGLHVIATERHESRRVDRQLFGRSARQGDPGSAQAFISIEDELFRRYLPRAVQQSLARRLSEGSAAGVPLARIAVSAAQFIAQREAFRQRRNVLKADDWLAEALSFASPEMG
jgi:preprotein translocase subunit SecA